MVSAPGLRNHYTISNKQLCSYIGFSVYPFLPPTRLMYIVSVYYLFSKHVMFIDLSLKVYKRSVISVKSSRRTVLGHGFCSVNLCEICEKLIRNPLTLS